MNALHPHEDEPCPSRLRFDRLVAGELEPAHARELERHAAGCLRCGAWLVSVRGEQAAFSPVLPDALVQRVRERSKRARALPVWAAPLLVAAGVLLAWVAWPAPPSGTQPGAVRSKGGQHVSFYVLHDGAVRPGSDGELVQPGDRLEFAYSSTRDAYLAVVSIDAAGKASAYYAQADRAAPVAAASRTVLDRSTVLDATLGSETVYALLCAQPIALEPVLRALERAPEQLPAVANCVIERYSLRKVAR